MLQHALAIDPAKDPENRLITLIMQKRARLFLEHVDDLFLEQDGPRALFTPFVPGMVRASLED